MTKFILILLLFPCFGLSQNNQHPNNYISIGLFDHKTGFSAIGYTRSLLQNNNNELFVGCGSIIYLNTFVIGYKNICLDLLWTDTLLYLCKKYMAWVVILVLPACQLGLKKVVESFIYKYWW